MKYFSVALVSLSLLLVGAGCAPVVDQQVQIDSQQQEQNVDDGSMMKEEVYENNDSMMKEDEGDSMMIDEDEKNDQEVMMEYGSYETYAPEKLAKAENGDVVLFFRASWCPTCKAVDADIRAHLNDIPKGLTILDVDYDNSTALKQKYGVTYQHTFVQVDKDGNQIAKWSGSPTLVELVKQVK